MNEGSAMKTIVGSEEQLDNVQTQGLGKGKENHYLNYLIISRAYFFLGNRNFFLESDKIYEKVHIQVIYFSFKLFNMGFEFG